MKEHSDGVVSLSRFRQADAAVLFEADHDPEHRRRFDFPAAFVPSLQHSRDVIARWNTERRTGERFSYAVRSVVTREILGGVELLPLLRVLVDPDNTASKRVALRNGFVEGGVFEGRARYILQSTQ